MKLFLHVFFFTLFLNLVPSYAQEAPPTPWRVVISPENSFDFTFYKEMKPVVSLGAGGWGPNWGWRGFGTTQRGVGRELQVAAPFEANKEAGEIVDVALRAWQSGPQSVSFRYTLKAAKDVPLTMFINSLTTSRDFQDGQAIITQSDGTTANLPLSFGGIREIGVTSQIAFQSTAGTYTLELDPPQQLITDNQLRILLAKDNFAQGEKVVTLKFTFPAPVSLIITDSDVAALTTTLPGADWFAFTPTQDVGPSALGFETWLDKPAGKHGGVREVGDHFEFADQTPVKFWGTNLSYGDSAPEKAVADFTAARFAKWGVNAVRMHKFTGSGWEGIGEENDATKMTAEGMERLDYFSAQLAKNGVYYGWSHTYHFRPKAANRDKLLAFDEIQNNLGGDSYGLINFAPDVQDLMIEMVVAMLKHQNPHTGKTYANDAALAFIEMQNEDDIFFYTSSELDKVPTYRKRVVTDFSVWLQEKYKSQDGLKRAWETALRDEETLAAQNIDIQTNPWMFGSDHLPQTQGGEKQRLLDNAEFFHVLQNRFYGRFAKAIRAAGYQGPLIGSSWQAPAMLPHLYNLRSDSFVGTIDRHNYFGERLFDSTLKNPGSGNLSVGLQQVARHPFVLSEWIHVYPALYSAEGPAIIAAYGLGLQGWDASYEFQSGARNSAFDDLVGNFPWGVWNADAPTQIGQFPILARMLARGDVKVGDVISTRRISEAELKKGEFNFEEKIEQQGDVKTFGGSVPASALAMGRNLIEWTPQPQPPILLDVAKFQNGNVITSNTGQLKWDANAGFFTLDTPGTKAVVGFANGKAQTLGDVNITVNSPYASVFVTAAGRDENLANAKRALISAVARNANSGMTYFSLDNRVLENGKAPIMIEPVKASFKFTRRPIAAVNVLDHDGKATGRTLAVKNGAFTIDEAQDKTIWYEIVFG